MIISDVPPSQVHMVWEEVAPLLQNALNHGQGDGVSVDVIRENLMMKGSSLWVIHEEDSKDIRGAAVVSVIEVPSVGKKLNVDLLGGSQMDEWVHDLHAVLIKARNELGAFCVEASCRLGLAEYLRKNVGWRKKAIIMEFTDG